MRRSKTLLCLACAILALGLVGWAGEAEKKVTIRFANSQSPEEPVSVEIEAFAQRVRDRSNGSIDIRVFHNGVLGDDNEALELCARGSNVMTYVDPAALCYYVPDYSIMHGPYLFDDPSEIKVLAFSDWGQEMADACAAKGIKVLDNCGSYFGTRQTITRRPFTNTEDIKGLKMRVPATPMWIETVNAMGASPTTVSFSEVYSALSQGVADAMENPLTAIFAARFHEVCKYVAMTSHFIAPGGLEMSSAVFDRLSPNQQTILVEEARKFAELSTRAILDAEKSIQQDMEKAGVTFVTVDTDAFRKATEIVYTKFPEWTPGLYDRVQKILTDYRAGK